MSIRFWIGCFIVFIVMFFVFYAYVFIEDEKQYMTNCLEVGYSQAQCKMRYREIQSTDYRTLYP